MLYELHMKKFHFCAAEIKRKAYSKSVYPKIIRYTIQKIRTKNCFGQPHDGSQQFIQSMDKGYIDNRCNGLKDEAAQFVYNSKTDKSHDAHSKHAECFGHNTADCQKQERNTYKGGYDGKNTDNFFYHSVFKSFSDSPHRQQENDYNKNNFQIHTQSNVHRLSFRTSGIVSYRYFNSIVSIESVVTNIYL